jgi:hypothetical protein
MQISGPPPHWKNPGDAGAPINNRIYTKEHIQTHINVMGLEVLTDVVKKSSKFCDITPCSLVEAQ